MSWYSIEGEFNEEIAKRIAATLRKEISVFSFEPRTPVTVIRVKPGEKRRDIKKLEKEGIIAK